MSVFIAGIVFAMVLSPLVAHAILWLLSRQLKSSDRPEPSGRNINSRDIPGNNSD